GESHRIDGEVATILVIGQGAILHNRLSGFRSVRLFTSSYEFHLKALIHQHSRAKGFKNCHLRMQSLAQGRSKLDTTPQHQYIDIIFEGTPHQSIPHIATNDIASNM